MQTQSAAGRRDHAITAMEWLCLKAKNAQEDVLSPRSLPFLCVELLLFRVILRSDGSMNNSSQPYPFRKIKRPDQLDFGFSEYGRVVSNFN